MKKWISICIFTLCLIFSVNCVWAEGSLSEKQSEAISLMNDLKIYTDITEENASNAITRAEFAKIIVRVMGVESSLTNAPRRIFSDVLPDNDAAASIELLYERGIMMGYGQAEFKPDAVLTLGEAVKVMISITGYSEWAEQQGGYPSGYYAVSNDILKGVSGAVNEEVNYTDAAVMIQNVLEGKKYRVITGYENNSVVSSDNNEEYMGYALNIYRYTGIVGAYGNTSLYSADDEYEENNVKIDNEIFETNGIDFSQYLGMKVTAYYKADDSGYYIMHVVADKKSEMIEVKSEDIAENVSKEKFEYYDNNKIKKAKISDNATFIYNGKKLDLIVLNSNLGLSVRSQVRKSSVLSDLGETSCKLMRKSDRIRHVLRGLVCSETEHHTLITSTDCIQLIVCHVVLFRFKRLVNTHSNIAGLLVDRGENTAGITVETIFCTVIADLTDGLADDLLDIHICLCCDLAHYHNKTCCCACLTCNTAHRILFH